MSENFGDKGYKSYFEKLEQQLAVSQSKSKTEYTNSKDNTETKKRRTSYYRVLRLKKSALAVFAAVTLCIVLIFVLCFKGCADNSNMQNSDIASSVGTDADKQDTKVEKISYKYTDDTVEIPSENDARSAIVVRLSDNTVIAERKAKDRVYPASTTKIMTLLVAVENIKDMNDTFTMTLDITDPLYVMQASVANFLNGEQVSMTDLLYGTILPSGADAAMGLAIKIAGSEKNFVKLMNEKVKELGLKDTNFANVTGLHDGNNYSTAYDMAVILNAAMKNELCREILSTYQHTTAVTKQNPQGILLSSTLFSYMYGTEPETAVILGGKTGFVNESGYCIASFGKNIAGTEEYIVVTMGNSSRWPAFYGQIDLYKEFAE